MCWKLLLILISPCFAIRYWFCNGPDSSFILSKANIDNVLHLGNLLSEFHNAVQEYLILEWSKLKFQNSESLFHSFRIIKFNPDYFTMLYNCGWIFKLYKTKQWFSVSKTSVTEWRSDGRSDRANSWDPSDLKMEEEKLKMYHKTFSYPV